MKREKSNILSRRPESIIFMLLIGFVSVLLNFTFSQNTFAEYKAKLSASISESTASIDGTEIIESSDETAEHAINLKVKTTNKTGYTATLSSKTDETALLNTNPAITTKISSISSASSLSNFPANTWGYSFNTNTDFNPIPAQSAPVNLIKTTEKSTAEENHTIKLGMKLNSSLKPGNYENKLIISVVSNPYTPKAIMTEGYDFNTKLKALETATNKIEHFKKSSVAPAASMNAVNVEDEDSDYEIKLWLDPTDKTAYYYAETEKVYLKAYSSKMFHYLSNLATLDLSSFDTSKVTDMSYMFEGMSNLTTLDLSSFDTSNVMDMREMFSQMHNLTSLDLSSFDTSNVTRMHSMFSEMRNLTSLNLSSFDTSQVWDMQYMFSDMRSLTSLDLSSFDTSKVRNMESMFDGSSNLTTLNLSNFNTSNVTNMDGMFWGLTSLSSLDLSNFDTSKVTEMHNVFKNMYNLTTLNLSSFNTSKVKSMYAMFEGVRSLTTLDLSNFNTSKVTDMYSMFHGMTNLTSLDLSNFDTSNVTRMHSMFSYMPSLTTLDLSSFNTSKVTDMEDMFSETPNLTTLDLSSFDTSNVTNMDHMFSLFYQNISKDKLETIYVNNDFNTAKLATSSLSGIFRNRKKLRGGEGSYLADPSTADESWLRIDDPANGRPGYFTRKP